MTRANHKSLLDCRSCRRLTHQLDKLRESHPDYWNRPVPATGPADASILVVGLAPGLKGANRTGIPFTGDASGELLHRVLDDLDLRATVRITNAVKCLPVKNLPSAREVRLCARHLRPELEQLALQANPVAIALGGVAHKAILACLAHRQADYPFAHAAVHNLPGFTLIDSYHCSRYNTQTRRLTPDMFRDVFASALKVAA